MDAFKKSYTTWVNNVFEPQHCQVLSPARKKFRTNEGDAYDTTSRPCAYGTYACGKFRVPTAGGDEATSHDAWLPQHSTGKIMEVIRIRAGNKTRHRNLLSNYEDKEGDQREPNYLLGLTEYTSGAHTHVVTTSEEVSSVAISVGFRKATTNAPPRANDAQDNSNTNPYRHVSHNFLPGLNSDLPGCIVNRPYICNGMEPVFLPDGALANNLQLIRDGQQCLDRGHCRRKDDVSCGSTIVPGDHVYVLGEDIHIVKQCVAYIGVYLVDALGTMRCKIGVVKCLPYQLNHFQNRHAIVVDVMLDDVNPGSPGRAYSSRHVPVENLMKGVAAMRFVDGKRPYINVESDAPPAAPFALSNATAVRWGWTKNNTGEGTGDEEQERWRVDVWFVVWHVDILRDVHWTACGTFIVCV